MLRYYCEELIGNPGGSNQSAEFVFRSVPPRISFILFDHSIRRSWQITNTRFNMQARDSLRTLRNAEAWIMNAGFEARGDFRAIMPCSSTVTLPLVMRLNCEISWDQPFVNITTRIDNDWVLWSTRASRWDEINAPPPEIVYLPPHGQSLTTPVYFQQPNQTPSTPAVIITDVTEDPDFQFSSHESSSSSTQMGRIPTYLLFTFLSGLPIGPGNYRTIRLNDESGVVQS